MHWHALYLRMKLQNSAGLPLRMLRKQRLKITFSSIDMTYRTSILTPTVMLNYVICPCISTCRNFVSCCPMLMIIFSANVNFSELSRWTLIIHEHDLASNRLSFTSAQSSDISGDGRRRKHRLVRDTIQFDSLYRSRVVWLTVQHAIHGDCAGGYRCMRRRMRSSNFAPTVILPTGSAVFTILHVLST